MSSYNNNHVGRRLVGPRVQLAALRRGHRHRLHRRYCCYSIKGTVVHKASDAAPLVQASQASEILTPVTAFAVLVPNNREKNRPRIMCFRQLSCWNIIFTILIHRLQTLGLGADSSRIVVPATPAPPTPSQFDSEGPGNRRCHLASLGPPCRRW